MVALRRVLRIDVEALLLREGLLANALLNL
jgi:hypothetical protein